MMKTIIIIMNKKEVAKTGKVVKIGKVVRIVRQVEKTEVNYRVDESAQIYQKETRQKTAWR